MVSTSVSEQTNLRLYVFSGIVGACVFDPDEDPDDFAAAADRGDEVLATIGADIAREHGLPPDWLHPIDPRRPTQTPAPAHRLGSASKRSSPACGAAERPGHRKSRLHSPEPAHMTYADRTTGARGGRRNRREACSDKHRRGDRSPRCPLRRAVDDVGNYRRVARQGAPSTVGSLLDWARTESRRSSRRCQRPRPATRPRRLADQRPPRARRQTTTSGVRPPSPLLASDHPIGRVLRSLACGQ